MIYDCFLFNNEFMLLEIRLKELASVIEKFVLVESTHSFAGEKKRLYYNEIKDNGIFGQFKNKIIHIVYDEVPKPTRPDNEISQRNSIGRGLVDSQPDDIIIVSDADEIINSKVTDKIQYATGPGRLRMKFFYYYFNCRANADWAYPAFCRFKNYPTAYLLRNGKGGFYQNTVNNAGWHFSYIMPVEEIARKISMLACHIQYNTAYYKDTKRIEKCRDNNTDLFERTNMKYSIKPLDAPECVMSNIEKYKEYIK